jgi:hypothetical protein
MLVAPGPREPMDRTICTATGDRFPASAVEEDLMRKLTTWTAAALVLAASAVAAMAQTQSLGAARLHAQIQNATPIVKEAACRGFGPFCPPGTTRRCGPYRCWCVRC